MNSWGLEVGDVVTWTSQAHGSSKAKTGVVAQIVEPGQLPDRKRFGSLYRGSGVGLPRKHRSYVVTVERALSTAVYWPIASKLVPKDSAREAR